MLPCFNHRTWTSVHLPPARQARQARQAIRGGRIRKGLKNERGADYHCKVSCRKMTVQTQRIMMLNQAQCVFLKTASMAYNNGEENASFNSEHLLPENHCNRTTMGKRMLLSTLEPCS